MTVSYMGARAAKENGMKKQFYHMAEMFYKEDDSRDTTLALRVFNLLRIKGWDVKSGVSGWGGVIVADKEEYKVFLQDYKESKKCIQNCIKFGF